MANTLHPRPASVEIGGKHILDHKLVHDTPGIPRKTHQPSPAGDATLGTTHDTGSNGGGQSATEEATNDDDDEDSSDVHDDEEHEPEVLAPSHGYGKGKGKRPAIRIEPAGDDESENDDDECASPETGHDISRHKVNPLMKGVKKRTFSNVSNTSLLFGDDDAGMGRFPRPKIARTLSHSDGTGLLTYTAANHGAMSACDNAIESSDEDKDARNDAGEGRVTDFDDEDYSGVNQIPDDDSDVELMEKEEESFIIYDEQQHATSLFSDGFNESRRLSFDSHGSAVPLDFTPDFANYPSVLQDVGFGQFFEPDPLPTSPEPIAKRKFSDSSAKRVRFDDEVQMSDSSTSSSSELDSGLFPDLFLDQDKLPPSLYQLMEADSETEHEYYSSSASEHSYWELGQEETRNIAPGDLEESSEAGSSGYESDEGDTTDEYDSDNELVATPQTPRPKSVLNRPSSAPGSKAASPRPFQRSSVGPTRGIFIHEDSRQAIAVTNRRTKTLTFFRPRTSVSLRIPYYAAGSSSASTANNSPRTAAQQFNASDAEFGMDAFNNPFMNSTDIMLTGIFGSAAPNTYLFDGNSIGPPEAFYPFVSVGQNGLVIDDEYDDDDYDDEEDFEDDINLHDFMDFDGLTDGETDVPATPATSMVAFNGSTPAQPTPLAESPSNRKRNSTDAMLEHFDRAGVTAFRNNQNRFRDIACLPHDPDLRASVSRPIRSGRSAETLMSPLRKRSSMSKKHGSSPFNNMGKASGRLRSSLMNRP